jgi:hypothetical protein
VQNVGIRAAASSVGPLNWRDHRGGQGWPRKKPEIGYIYQKAVMPQKVGAEDGEADCRQKEVPAEPNAVQGDGKGLLQAAA